MWRQIDDVLRFGYVLIAPAIIVVLGGLLPITGMVLTTGIATVIALVGSQAWVDRVSLVQWVGKPLAKFGQLGEYYREHPPKPLPYYVLYPLFAPYWLLKREARRELLAYKRIGALAVVITAVSGCYDYFHNWSPLPANYFFKAQFATSILGLLITFMFVMPIVTTLIRYRQRGYVVRMIVLVSIASALGAVMAAVTLSNRDMVRLSLRERIKARILWQPGQARDALRGALQRATTQADQESAERAAHDALEAFFKPDEAATFRVIASDGVAVLATKTKNHRYAWTARTKTGWAATAGDLPLSIRSQLELDDPAAAPWP